VNDEPKPLLEGDQPKVTEAEISRVLWSDSFSLWDQKTTIAKSVFGGLAVAGVVGAYFLQPLLAYSDPPLLAIFGLTLAVGIWNLFEYIRNFGNKRFAITSFLCLLIGGLGLFGTLMAGFWTAAETERTCGILEDRMLSDGGHRADDAQVFTALKCAPQFYADRRAMFAKLKPASPNQNPSTAPRQPPHPSSK